VPVGVGSLAEAVVRHYRQPHGPAPGCCRSSRRPPRASSRACGRTSPSPCRPARPSWPGSTAAPSAPPPGRCCARAWTPPSRSPTTPRGAPSLTWPGSGSGPGPCGAATLAGVRAALSDPERRAALRLPADAVLVLLSTEGDAR
jgi:diaminopropionate ammonia-lyase